MKQTLRISKVLWLLAVCCLSTAFSVSAGNLKERKVTPFNIPREYLRESDSIPPFWKATIEEIEDFIKNNVRKGRAEIIGTSAGGRPITAVFYGKPRQGTGTTTYSGSLSVKNIGSYRGTDNGKTVYLGLAGVHGFELEGIVGVVNLMSVFETGKDLNGTRWPQIEALLDSIDRIILIPLLNPDGRARLPIRMEAHNGSSRDAYKVHEYLNTGGKEGGRIIGWPAVKEFIPMDFSKFEFPGGYPNDAGVNIMHDDFFGKIQPETKALFDLTAREKPDLILNMHTGAPKDNYYMRMHKPYCEPSLLPVFEALYTAVHTGLTETGLQGSRDVRIEADAKRTKLQTKYNLNTALNLHCGALCVVVEATSHGFSGRNRAGEPVMQTPGMILHAELTAHMESMRFLYRTGGRSKWDVNFSEKK